MVPTGREGYPWERRAFFGRGVHYARGGAPRGPVGDPGRTGIIEQGAPVRSGLRLVATGWGVLGTGSSSSLLAPDGRAAVTLLC